MLYLEKQVQTIRRDILSAIKHGGRVRARDKGNVFVERRKESIKYQHITEADVLSQ